ncbi:hypothetical protein L227DRAFT_245923 [Lentinus tigrinus ALCF2SS1-6]|uniref:Uncharacterized protein n=1 Tax=Lentinus tigrinus ALCF2SS1-6 TaxID=1328759 RepID=A0A5C2S1Z0_9APHY|nr:hypothetical protein L227DRAFT_245923 [Lentinus tigrinus ALCF2SS1-6]
MTIRVPLGAGVQWAGRLREGKLRMSHVNIDVNAPSVAVDRLADHPIAKPMATDSRSSRVGTAGTSCGLRPRRLWGKTSHYYPSGPRRIILRLRRRMAIGEADEGGWHRWRTIARMPTRYTSFSLSFCGSMVETHGEGRVYVGAVGTDNVRMRGWAIAQQ